MQQDSHRRESLAGAVQACRTRHSPPQMPTPHRDLAVQQTCYLCVHRAICVASGLTCAVP